MSGLYYLRARYYDPTLGRFWTQDYAPAGASDPQALNDYAYVRNSPTSLADPSGLWCPRNPEDCIPDPVEDFLTETIPEAVDDAQGGLAEGWDDFLSDLGRVRRPLAGAALIIVADLPVLIGEPLCALTFWSGITCVAVNAYAVFVATPATYIGLCMIAEDNFLNIPKLDDVCGKE